MAVATDRQVVNALTEQIALLAQHSTRLSEKMQRYSANSLPWMFVNIEWQANREKRDLLIALSNGMTVQPS